MRLFICQYMNDMLSGFPHYPPAIIKKGYSLFPKIQQGIKMLSDKIRQHIKVITTQGYVYLHNLEREMNNMMYERMGSNSQ